MRWGLVSSGIFGGIVGGGVLEVGAGTGRFTLPALRKGYHLTATDVNEVMLKTLQTKLTTGGFGDRCHVRTEDVFGLSFPSNHFDFVFCLHLIPRFLNLEDQRAALTELGRVIKPGGTLLLNYRNSRSPYNLVYKGHAISPMQLQPILDAMGMQIVERRVKHILNRTLLNMLPIPVGKALSTLDRACERLLPGLGWDVFMTVIKQTVGQDAR